MVFTNWGFSIVRDWLLNENPAAPSGMMLGTGSKYILGTDRLLGSPLYPTFHPLTSYSGIGFIAQLEHTIIANDIITGSLAREIGLNAVSGGSLFFRSLIPETELNGSVVINSFLLISV